jgi:putative tryptophan/tyrosine transport system substrate-binding protein
VRRRHATVLLFIGLVSGNIQVAAVQQTARIPRIGYLPGTSLSANSARTDAFRQGLRELGYIEGKNIVIDWRSADGKRTGYLCSLQN